MNEAELPPGNPEAIEIGAHFSFRNGCGNTFAAQHLAPSTAFHRDFLASFGRQKLYILINTIQSQLQNSNLSFNC